MKTKTLFLFAGFAACFAAFGLTDVYWINSTGGDWNSAANWSSGAVPNSSDCHVHVTNETAVTIALGDGTYYIGGLSFSGADHVISGAARDSGLLVFEGGATLPDVPVIDVADGIAAAINASRARSNGACGISKTGKGTLVVNGDFGRAGKYSVFELAEGIVSNRCTSANSMTFTGSCIVRSGACLAVANDNVVDDMVIIHLEDGAIFDNCLRRDSIGGITGQGVATNLSSNTSSCWNGGPLDFAGRLYGWVTLAPNADYVGGDEGYLRVGASNTLANAKIEIKPDGAYTNLVRFAPGVGAFSIDRLIFLKPLPVVLEDTDGEPITLTAGFAPNYKNAMFAGRGNFVKSNSYTWTITNDLYAATGMLGAKAGIIEAGTGAEGFDAVLENISRLDVGSGATFRMKNYADTTWDMPITGAGTVESVGPGVWTINNFSMTNGTLAVVAPATELVLAGGVAKNVKTSFAPTTFKTTITGGDYSFADLRIIRHSAATGTAVLELNGGLVEVTSFSGPVSGSISAPAEGKIILNGGVLRAGGSASSQSWWDASLDPDERVKAYVGSAGAIIDVASDSFNRLLTINWPFVTGVENGTDGGFVKLGRGTLRLSKPYAGTGVFEVREGRFEVDSGMGATPFGTAQVRIGPGEMYFPSAGSYSVAELSYTNCATLRLSGGVALTVGPGDAAADSVVGRCGHGVLAIMSGTAGSALGDSSSVTVNGGLSNDSTTGILRQPIFERRQVTGSVNQYRARFLKCDANNALVPATPVEFDPSTSSTSTVAQITADLVTVSANASVGALCIELSKKGNGLTVADGATLSVGSGNAGSVAPILLNNHTAGASAGDQTGISGAGVIDFGASEGVIVVNGNGGLQNPVQIDTALAGSGGVTFAAPMLFAAGYRGVVALTKLGTYTGGTWIENVHVSARAAGCFGSGTIHVYGSEVEGGALEIAPTYDSNTFANTIEIAGSGPAYPANNDSPGYFGALIVRKGGVTLSGGVTLAADAKIASGSRSGQKPIVFSAPIVGPGGMTVSGTSPFRFAAANTYAGGTVITNGTVEVTDAGTLGSGPVKICAGGVLRFVNESAKTVSNAITGDGRIEMDGAAVTLTAADGFAGDVTGAGSVFGDGGYVKSGEGEVSFTNSLAYTGATLVEGGTLRLGQAPFDVPPASESMAFRLDASAGDTITEEDGAVVAWADADGRDVAFTNVAANGPSLAVGALNEKDALHFDGEIKRRLIANAATPELYTVFFVNRVATTHPYDWSNMGIFGMLDNDRGLRFLDKTRIKADSMFLDGVIHVDGVSNMTAYNLYDTANVPNNEFVVLEAEAAIPAKNITFAVGDYWGQSGTYTKRAYSGDIAEVIAYDRWLTEEERITAEKYLQNKWGLKEVANDVFTNVLPVATAVTLAEGAALDLAGGFQEIASLSGAGTVENSSTLRATLRLSAGTSVFTGAFDGDIRLEIGPGAVLDLGGGTIHVSVLKNRGRIVNGTVVADREIGGMLIIMR